MNIVWNIHLYPPVHNCGSEWMAHNISKFLMEKGHNVRVVLNQANQHKITRAYDFEGVMVYPPQHTDELFRRADYIFTHLDYTQDSIWKGRKFNKRVVQFVHNDSIYQAIKNAPEAWVVYNSKWIQKKLNYPNKDFVLTPPCDYRYYNVCEKPIDNPYITLINLDWNKGGEVLTKIAEAFPDKKFLGVEGSYNCDDKGQFTKQPGNVKVIPNTPNILEVYKQTRVLIMPSFYESWGRTATEAMCSGIPVIASRTPGLDENLDYAGLFVDDRDDIDAWIRWIKRLDDKKFYHQVSDKSRKRSMELDPIEQLTRFNEWLYSK